MNYLKFFSLRQEPFSNAPVSRFYFNSEEHARALVRMMFAIENMKGLAVLVGDIGAGKSTTARRILEGLPADRFEVAMMVMVQTGVSPQWFLVKMAHQLGIREPAADKTRLLGQLYRRLYALHKAGRKVVVLIDEAQMLNTRELMEELRGLLNMEIPEQKLLTLCLFGLPELESHLKLDPPLYQRIAVRARLERLGPKGTESYIKHRLRLAGAQRMLFTQEAVERIHHSTSGVPRLINTVCDNALFEGFLCRANPITSKVVASVVADLGYDGVTEIGRAAGQDPQKSSPALGWDAGAPFRPAAPVERLPRAYESPRAPVKSAATGALGGGWMENGHDDLWRAPKTEEGSPPPRPIHPDPVGLAEPSAFEGAGAYPPAERGRAAQSIDYGRDDGSSKPASAVSAGRPPATSPTAFHGAAPRPSGQSTPAKTPIRHALDGQDGAVRPVLDRGAKLDIGGAEDHKVEPTTGPEQGERMGISPSKPLDAAPDGPDSSPSAMDVSTGAEDGANHAPADAPSAAAPSADAPLVSAESNPPAPMAARPAEVGEYAGLSGGAGLGAGAVDLDALDLSGIEPGPAYSQKPRSTHEGEAGPASRAFRSPQSASGQGSGEEPEWRRRVKKGDREEGGESGVGGWLKRLSKRS